MPNILHIETSGKACSVAISSNETVIAHRLIEEERSHASSLTIMIEEALSSCQLSPEKLDAVSVSEGPGSYTGLRIGISVAKGICYGANIPLIAVPTLQVILAHLKYESGEKHLLPEKADLFVPMIDARRMEVYDCIFDAHGKIIREVKADIIDQTSFQEELKDHSMVFFGDGSNKCQDTITHENAIFVNGILPDAKYMTQIALQKYNDKDFVDLAYYEPFYLKEFQATVAKNTVLSNLTK